jgi:hypothetical protein
MKINNKELISIYFDKHPNIRRKSPIVWGEINNGIQIPLFYIRKPKYINNQDFKKVLENLIINIKK